MKKGKITVCITIAIACFALATVMCMQFKVVKETDITSIETMREEELRTELANWKKMYKEAQEQYNEKTAKLAEYKEKEQSTEDSSKLVEKELEQTNMYLGKTDVEGQGITIKIQDVDKQNTNQEENVDPLSAEDLLVIVDYLKLAGAEAISVNDQRVVPTTSIECGGNIITINGQKIGSPFTIKAIGLPENLANLNRAGGYLSYMKNASIGVDLKKSNNILVKKGRPFWQKEATLLTGRRKL